MRRNYLICFLFLLQFSIIGQNSVVNVTHLSLEEGLSQSNVRCILQDKTGFLWIGTQDGLNRYDGYNFRIFKNNPNDTNSLSDNMITCLLEDKKGFLWIGTLDGLNKYDPRTGKFIHYFAKSGEAPQLHGKSILSLAEDSSGNIWIGTHLAGLSEFNPLTGKIKTYLNDPRDNNSICSNNIMTLLKDRKGRMWIGTFGGGLDCFDITSQKFLHFRNRTNDKNSLSNDFVNIIKETKNGDIYIGTGAGLNFIDFKSNDVNRVNIPGNRESVTSKANVQTIAWDKNGKLWIGTETNGLICLNEQTGKYESFSRQSTTLKENNVTSLLIDDNEIVWVGTHSAGLTKLKKDKINFENISADARKNIGLTDANIWPIFEDSKGNIWIGTNNGLNVLDKNNRTIKKYFNSKTDLNSISNNRIWSINEDKNGNIWVGTQDGLNRINCTQNKITRFQFSSKKKSIPFNLIKYVYPDKDGVLWLGTWGSGVIRFNPTNQDSKVFLHDLKDKSSISDDVVFYITEDSKGILWVCTSNGLNQFDKLTGKFTSYTHTPGDKAGIQANAVYFILEDKNNVYWIASHGGGLIRFDQSTQKFINFTEADGLPNNVVYGILRDIKNNLWLSTNKGISRYSPKEKSFKNYNTRDGLPNNEFNAGAFCKTRFGKFYFGTISGLTSFYPDSLIENKFVPKIVVTDFKIFDKSPDYFNCFSDGDQIQLTYKDNYFSFEFASLDFTEPENNQYSYMLQGFDKDWIYSGTRRYAAYTHLDAGHYLFSLRASNNNGIWNQKGITIGITITPPFWKTWWFRTLLLISILSIVTYISKIKIDQLKRQTTLQQKFSKQLIEFQEAEKKRIASELHDGIGQNLLIITNRAQIGLMGDNPQKMKQQLMSIDETAAESINEIRNIAHHLHPNLLDQIGLTQTLRSMIQKIEGSVPVTFSASIDEIDNLFQPENELNIYRIIQESINNITKHAKASRGMITIEKMEKSVKIIIQDDGKGIDEKKIKSYLTSSEGFGLRNMKERVKYLNGTLSINSIPNKGTTIIIIIPIQENGKKT